MKPRTFDYVRAETLDEALTALAEGGEDVKVLAGGQSLVAILNFRLAEPNLLVDINRIHELNYIKVNGDMIEIGAAKTQAELQDWPELRDKSPLLVQAIPYLGHFQTRNRGTVCGSLAHADPSSELPLCLATLGGEVVLRSKSGTRTMKATDFQTGMLSTARRTDELMVAARFPIKRADEDFSFTEMAQRRGDFAIVAVAAMVRNGTVRLGVGGVADAPVVREWDGLQGDAIDDALNAFAWDLGGYDDIHATARYRRELVRRLGRRVIEEARA